MLECRQRRTLSAGKFPYRTSGILQVVSCHDVGEIIVVDDRRVLVGTRDAIDAEALAVTLRVGAEVEPETRGLDQHLRTVVAQEVLVAGDVHVLANGVSDVGVDVVLGRAGGIIGRGFVTVDGAPGKGCALVA